MGFTGLFLIIPEQGGGKKAYRTGEADYQGGISAQGSVRQEKNGDQEQAIEKLQAFGQKKVRRTKQPDPYQFL
ncbi:hypothetical protein [Chitinophaga sp. XS-30]|uniref:hypothetical protein n=1 Tax=Chitinophaga sp. XS-30 TaxID=2604421 RepID=UPI0011DDCC23|nr:hypothetical protein [Chitinophaga sp. XS-30]QEH40839.1 hypothetical protein FW415_08105 [Chitinophaga sp. XS-30]